jgi:amidohydrolase
VLLMVDLATAIDQAAKRHDTSIVEISRDIHAHPEVRFEERHAHAVLTAFLAAAGWQVEVAPGGLETAFVARLPGRTGGPVVALLAEYDALPGIGHGCGHNLIAAMAVGAARIAQDVAAELGVPGQVRVIGTPGEEGGGGKILLADAGVFASVDAALMLHPGGDDDPVSGSSAREGIDVRFHGRSAHAASAPDAGIDALQAGLGFLTLVNAARPTLPRDANIYGIVLEGGRYPNIVVDECKVRVQVRADSGAVCEKVLERVLDCARGAALALGAQMEWERFVPAYRELHPDPTLSAYVREGMRAVGRDAAPRPGGGGSTDAGNLSLLLPTAHGAIRLTDEPGHSHAFAAAAGGDQGDRVATDGARILAYAVLRALGGSDQG